MIPISLPTGLNTAVPVAQGARVLTTTQELAKLGAEAAVVNVDDAESLKRAFHGAYGAFCVTFFWEHFSPEKELAQARALAQAAKAAGICCVALVGTNPRGKLLGADLVVESLEELTPASFEALIFQSP